MNEFRVTVLARVLYEITRRSFYYGSRTINIIPRYNIKPVWLLAVYCLAFRLDYQQVVRLVDYVVPRLQHRS